MPQQRLLHSRYPDPALITSEVFGTSGHDVLLGSVFVEGGVLADYTNEYTILYGLAGDDVLDGQGRDDYLVPGPGADSVDGGSGADFLDLDDSVGPVTVDLAAFFALEASGDRGTVRNIEDVAGSPAGDRITSDGLGHARRLRPVENQPGFRRQPSARHYLAVEVPGGVAEHGHDHDQPQ